MVFVLGEKNNCTSWVIHKYHNTTKTVNSSHKLETMISCWLRHSDLLLRLVIETLFDLSHSVLVETSSNICPFQAAEYIWAKEKLTKIYHNRNDKTKTAWISVINYELILLPIEKINASLLKLSRLVGVRLVQSVGRLALLSSVFVRVIFEKKNLQNHCKMQFNYSSIPFQWWLLQKNN